MKLRIALYTHSLNPRGGVVHAISLAEALQKAGHKAAIFAPAPPGTPPLFRKTSVPVNAFVAAGVPSGGSLGDLVRLRQREYARCVQEQSHPYDIHHVHDGMSGSALAPLRETGRISCLVRTVHHLETYADPFLNDSEERSIRTADAVVCVSELWTTQLRERFGIEAVLVRNGVDARRFAAVDSAGPCERSDKERAEASARSHPLFLCVGGVERRKNTLASLRAFLRVCPTMTPAPMLVIAGGISLLDHSEYRRQFDAERGASPWRDRVQILGAVSDEALGSLYRQASALVFPSLVEGFGLAVLEAMASGTPVITSRIAPFTEYLADADAMLVTPEDPGDIAAAMQEVLRPETRQRLRANGVAVAGRFTWEAAAAAHLRLYQELVVIHGVCHA